ncbi:MAG: cupin domain-containing protein [Candidatus Micrarchaeota archaeon]
MPEKIVVKKLPTVYNVCNQILREVCKSADASIAHVEMPLKNKSLLHKHGKFTEIYYILQGEGILSVGGEKFDVAEETLVEIPPGFPHMLENTGKIPLKHLVISVPAFDPNDVIML